MKRNDKFYQEKDIWRMKMENYILRQESYKLQYIPLEEPRFAGWEYYISLSDAGLRRKDAPHLLDIIKLLGGHKSSFTKDVRMIKHMRKYDHSYSKIIQNIPTKRFGIYLHSEFHCDTFTKHISEKTYNSLSEKAKSYFYKYFAVKFIPWTGKYEHEYYLNHHKFPYYELVFRVQKSYWTKLGVPNGDVISQYTKLHDKLEHLCVWEGGRYPTWWRTNGHRKHRHTWKMFCNHLRLVNFVEEQEEYYMRASKVTRNNHRF